MEIVTALAVFAALAGSLWLDVHLIHRLGRRYYRLVCLVPTRPARIAALPEPGRPIRGESLVIGVASEGLQVRSTRRKHHVLLRVAADGQVRAGVSVWVWLCVLGWLGGMGVTLAAALHQPMPAALLLAGGIASVVVVFWAAMRRRTHAMIAATERVVAARCCEERLREIG